MALLTVADGWLRDVTWRGLTKPLPEKQSHNQHTIHSSGERIKVTRSLNPICNISKMGEVLCSIIINPQQPGRQVPVGRHNPHSHRSSIPARVPSPRANPFPPGRSKQKQKQTTTSNPIPIRNPRSTASSGSQGASSRDPGPPRATCPRAPPPHSGPHGACYPTSSTAAQQSP